MLTRTRIEHLIWLGASLLAVQCDEGTSRVPGDTVDIIERQEVDHAWSLAFTIGGAGDSTLLSPSRVKVQNGRIAVFDDGRSAVLMFDTAGNFLWQLGREGPGPDEFARVRDIAFDSQGALYVLDAGNGRISRIAGGEIVDRIHMETTGPGDALIPGRTQMSVLAVGPAPLTTIDAAGQVIARDSLPHIDLEVAPIATQAVTAGTDERWAIAFVFGGGWIGAPSGEIVGSFYRPLVEDPGFPRSRAVREGGCAPDGWW